MSATADKAETGDSQEFSTEMRSRWLTADPADFDIMPSSEYPTVYGVLMEWPAGDDDTLTLVAFCEGSASVYIRSGGGMIGGHTDEEISNRARALVESATSLYEEAAPATEFPYPARDRVRFYLLGFPGVRVVDVEMSSVFEANPYSEAWDHGWGVFQRYLVVTGQHLDGDGETVGYRKEWSGIEGYVNCLLTAMSRGMVSSIEISARGPVPDLDQMSEGNDDLQGWLRAQEFPYASLRGKDVVRLIRRLSGISGLLPFITRSAELRTVHAEENGDSTATIFDIQVAPFDKQVRIDLAPRTDRRVIADQKNIDSRSPGRA
jgi:hypothetical protein